MLAALRQLLVDRSSLVGLLTDRTSDADSNNAMLTQAQALACGIDTDHRLTSAHRSPIDSGGGSYARLGRSTTDVRVRLNRSREPARSQMVATKVGVGESGQIRRQTGSQTSLWPRAKIVTLQGTDIAGKNLQMAVFYCDNSYIGLCGAPKRIRTSGLCLRRAALYPAELWVRKPSLSRRGARGQARLRGLPPPPRIAHTFPGRLDPAQL